MVPLTLAATAAWARRLPIDSATSRGRVPSGTCLVEPSGRRRVIMILDFRLQIADWNEAGKPGPNLQSKICNLQSGLLADVWHQRHKPGPLDGGATGPLKGGAVAAALAAEELALAGTELLQARHVLVID